MLCRLLAACDSLEGGRRRPVEQHAGERKGPLPSYLYRPPPASLSPGVRWVEAASPRTWCCQPARAGAGRVGHTFASLMIAAGVNAKALSTYMGRCLDHDHAGSLRPSHVRQRG